MDGDGVSLSFFLSACLVSPLARAMEKVAETEVPCFFLMFVFLVSALVRVKEKGT